MSNTDTWLTLIEYSNKYDVSISTLRRKIKSGLLEYDMDNGKYYVPDMDIKEALRRERNKKLKARRNSPVQANKNQKSSKADIKTTADFANKKEMGPSERKRVEAVKKEIPEVKIQDKKVESNEAIFSTANRLLDELKKAYTFVLQEKESQIIHLRSELSDLKTLVRVLEDEVMKLRSK